MPATLTVVVVLTTAGCNRTEHISTPSGQWVGDITTEGQVTTVVNEAGSVWGGTATLVEEASIGVESGAAEYMLGAVGGVFATDNRIFVVDTQVPVVRAYDLGGTYLGDLGQEGQGPGEYSRPSLIVGDGKGRVFVLDYANGRFALFREDGDSLGTWPAQEAICCAVPMVMAPSGNLWARARVPNDENRSGGVREFGPDGPAEDLRMPKVAEAKPNQIGIEIGGRTIQLPVPFSPQSGWAFTPAGTIVSGASDDYRFAIESAAGSVIDVRQHWTPVPIEDEEADWHRRLWVSGLRMEAAGPEWTWDGAEMPNHKPAFNRFLPTVGGDIWVGRMGPGVRATDCVEDPLIAGYIEAVAAPCWTHVALLDIFDAEGRYLGPVEVPAGMRTSPAVLNVRGDQVVSVVENELGTIMVKRYRLVLPQ